MYKKILIVTDNLRDQINGVVTTYKNLETYAVRDNYQFVYLDPGWFSYIDCPGYNQVKIAYPRKVGEILEKVSPDYIHIATEGPIGLCVRNYCNLHGYRYTTAYHTKFPEGLRKLFNIPEKLTWPLIRWFHKNSSVILTTTDSMVTELKAHEFKNNIVSWTRGVDREVFQFKSNLKNKKPILLCVSRVSKEKNLEDFFNLDFPDCEKIMVGDGPMRETYQNKYKDVYFVGFKTGKELAKYYQNADVFVFPSKWETFGIVMIESMASGTPVAAYPVQGPIDVIDNNITGILSDNLESAVKECLKLDRKLVSEASKKFTWLNAWEIFKNNLIKK